MSSPTSPNLVKELRERTGAGFLECKKALVECHDDLDKAAEYLRQRGIASASKKSGRATSDGLVLSYIHGQGKIGVLIEVNCETDFVAKTDEFRHFVNDVAMHVAAADPQFLAKEAVPSDVVDKERVIFRAQAEGQGKKGPVVDKIVEGKVAKYFSEVCLLQQPFVKDPDKSIETLVKEMIAKIGENITVRRFVRYQLGEGVRREPTEQTHG